MGWGWVGHWFACLSACPVSFLSPILSPFLSFFLPPCSCSAINSRAPTTGFPWLACERDCPRGVQQAMTNAGDEIPFAPGRLPPSPFCGGRSVSDPAAPAIRAQWHCSCTFALTFCKSPRTSPSSSTLLQLSLFFRVEFSWGALGFRVTSHDSRVTTLEGVGAREGGRSQYHNESTEAGPPQLQSDVAAGRRARGKCAPQRSRSYQDDVDEVSSRALAAASSTSSTRSHAFYCALPPREPRAEGALP